MCFRQTSPFFLFLKAWTIPTVIICTESRTIHNSFSKKTFPARNSLVTTQLIQEPTSGRSVGTNTRHTKNSEKTRVLVRPFVKALVCIGDQQWLLPEVEKDPAVRNPPSLPASSWAARSQWI